MPQVQQRMFDGINRTFGHIPYNTNPDAPNYAKHDAYEIIHWYLRVPRLGFDVELTHPNLARQFDAAMEHIRVTGDGPGRAEAGRRILMHFYEQWAATQLIRPPPDMVSDEVMMETIELRRRSGRFPGDGLPRHH